MDDLNAYSHLMPLPYQYSAAQFSKLTSAIFFLPEGFLWTNQRTFPSSALSSRFQGTDTTEEQLSIHVWWEMAVPALSGIILKHALSGLPVFSIGIEPAVVTGLITHPFLAAFLFGPTFP